MAVIIRDSLYISHNPVTALVAAGAALSTGTATMAVAVALVASGASHSAGTATMSVSTGPPTQLYIKSTGTGTDGLTAATAFNDQILARNYVRTLLPSMVSDITITVLDSVIPSAALALTSADSGQNGHKVIWNSSAALGDANKPGLRAMVPITGWAQTDPNKNIWQADYAGSVDPRFLVVNDQRATRAKRGSGLSGTPTRTSTGYTAVGDAILADPNPTGVELLYAGQYNFPRNKVTAVNAGTGAITMLSYAHGAITNSPGWSYQGPDGTYDPSHIGTNWKLPSDVENCYADFIANKTPGTFYHNGATGKMLYIPRQYEDMAVAVVLVSTGLEQIVTAIGASDIDLSGLSVEGAHWNMTDGFANRAGNWHYTPTNDYNGAVGDGQTNMVTPPAAIYLEGCTRVNVIDGNHIRHHAGVGVKKTLNCVSCSVKGNLIEHCSAGGGINGDASETLLSVCSSGGMWRDNLIQHVGLEFFGCQGINAPMITGYSIDHNEVRDVPYSGIEWLMGGGVSTTWTDKVASNLVQNNRIIRSMTQTADGGCLKTNNANNGTTVTGNYGEECGFGLGGSLYRAGLYFDGGANGITAHDNVFKRIQKFGLYNAIANPNTINVGVNYSDEGTHDSTTGGPPTTPNVDTAPTVTTNPTESVNGAAIFAASGIREPYNTALRRTNAAGHAVASGVATLASTVALVASGAAHSAGTATMSVGSSFTDPSSLSGLQQWLDANATGYSNGDSVSAWFDRTSNHADLTSSGFARPTFRTAQVNSLPAMDFDANDWMASALSLASGSFTVFIVCNPTTASSASVHYFMDADDGGSNRLILASLAFNGTGTYTNVGYYDGTAWREIAAGTTGWQQLAFVLDSGGADVRRNGSSLGTAAYSPRSIGTSVGFGASTGGGGYMTQKVAEFILYNRKLNGTEIGQLEGYLATKYGL